MRSLGPRALVPLLLAAALALPRPAAAKSTSIVTLGIGTGAVVERVGPADNSQAIGTMAGLGVNLRLRFLYVLGLELSYQAVAGTAMAATNVPTPAFQVSALVYLYPGKTASLFLLAGLGGPGVLDAFNPTSTGNSYHGGFGMEVALTPHWTLTGDARVNLPGYASVMERIDPLSVVKNGASAVLAYYNLDTWELGVGVRYYL